MNFSPAKFVRTRFEGISPGNTETAGRVKKHPEVQEAHNTPQSTVPRVNKPVAAVATLQRSKVKVDETYIIEALKGKPNGTKVRITFKVNAFSEVAYLVMMKDKIITMDDYTFTRLYAVGISGQWDRISRTCEVTINFNRGSLKEWFAPRLGRGIEKFEVI
jgi:hypothetical protein